MVFSVTGSIRPKTNCYVCVSCTYTVGSSWTRNKNKREVSGTVEAFYRRIENGRNIEMPRQKQQSQQFLINANKFYMLKAVNEKYQADNLSIK